VVHALEATYTVLHRQAFLQKEVRRQEDPRSLLGPVARRNRSRRTWLRPCRSGKGDDAACPRLAVATHRDSLKGRAGRVAIRDEAFFRRPPRIALRRATGSVVGCSPWRKVEALVAVEDYRGLCLLPRQSVRSPGFDVPLGCHLHSHTGSMWALPIMCTIKSVSSPCVAI
jgi:hypothetical protein